MIRNLTRNAVLASRVQVAANPWQRMKGLLGQSELLPGSALVITHCQSIHMFFMKFPIDVVFCDRQGNVVGVCENIKPFSLSPLFCKASYAIELPAGTVAATQTRQDDQIEK